MVKKEYDDRFQLLFLPPYASQLSGVETLWAIYKRELGKHIDRQQRDMSMVAFQGDVDWMYHMIKVGYDGRKFFMSARD